MAPGSTTAITYQYVRATKKITTRSRKSLTIQRGIMPATRLTRCLSKTFQLHSANENKSLHSCSYRTTGSAGPSSYPSSLSSEEALKQSLSNLKEDMNVPRYSISGESKVSYASKYGTLCQGKTDMGTVLRQQLAYQGKESDSHQWMFLNAMNHLKISKEYQMMGQVLRDISECNIERFQFSPKSLTAEDILHMKSYIHHVQNPRYGLTHEKKSLFYQEVKKFLLGSGVDSSYFHA